MSTALDHRASLKPETVFGTAVVTDRFVPWTDGHKGTFDPRPKQADGMISGGRRTMLGSRRFLRTGQAEVTLKCPLESRGGGYLLSLGFGVATVTTISGGAQILAHPGIAGTVLPSGTVQLVKVRNDGTERVETYSGCTAKKLTIEQPNEAEPTIEVVLDGLAMTTATAAAAPSYTQGVIYGAHMASVGLGGSLTGPTTTALATGLTAFADFRSWKFELDQAIAIDRWNLNAGLRGQPFAAQPKIKFTAEAEFNAATLPNALTAGTALPFYNTWTSTEVLGSGVSTAQLVIPQMFLNKDLPDPKGSELITFSADFDVTNDGSHQDCYFVYRTLDTAL